MGASNGNLAASSEALIDLFTQHDNYENNNNPRVSPSVYPSSPRTGHVNGASSAPCFGGMTNEEIQNYLITKFQDMGGFPNTTPKKTSFNANQQFYQNSNAFPNIPPLTNHYSNADIASLIYKEPCSSSDNLAPLAQGMSVGHSENSLMSNSPDSSKDSSPDAFSSDDGIPFIMPLSHKGTLKATDEDGRVRLIVPVSPSESVSDVPNLPIQVSQPTSSGNTLKVPTSERLVALNAPITRTTSEKVPNKSEMMTALRSQWTRHTTK